jgi:hypothetical protein
MYDLDPVDRDLEFLCDYLGQSGVDSLTHLGFGNQEAGAPIRHHLNP